MLKRLVLVVAAGGVCALAVYLVWKVSGEGNEYYSGLDLAIARTLNSLDPYIGPFMRKTLGSLK